MAEQDRIDGLRKLLADNPIFCNYCIMHGKTVDEAQGALDVVAKEGVWTDGKYNLRGTLVVDPCTIGVTKRKPKKSRRSKSTTTDVVTQ